jgi:broad specificity phosphatase PhoE
MKTHSQRFFLIRHGETDWNKVRRFQGHSDIALNAEGRAQALAVRDAVLKLGIEAWYSSDLSRAHETAKILIGDHIPIGIDPRLRELFLGEAEGHTKEMIAEKWPEVWIAWQSLKLADWNIRFPSGETRVEMLARFEEGLAEILRRHPRTVVGLVCHGGLIRTFVHKHRPDFTEPFLIPNCAVVPFSFNGVEFKFEGPESPDKLLAPGASQSFG